jgi:hypothetical protein
MLRTLLALLVLGCGVVPPGICSCRLEALLFTEAQESCSDDSDHHDDDCLSIHQECVTSSAPLLASPSAWDALAATADAHEPVRAQAVVRLSPFHWSDGSPLYLTLRALLI